MNGEKKKKFRSRKLENDKPLLVFREDAVDNPEDFADSIRSVQPIATGVDKEEEDEHHLRIAMEITERPKYIPIPDALAVVADYEELYPVKDAPPKSYLRVVDVMDEESMLNGPKYNADPEDIMLAQRANLNISDLECVFDRIEEIAAYTPLENMNAEMFHGFTQEDARPKLDPGMLTLIFDHWKLKKSSNPNLRLLLKHEDIGKIGTDPFVCFRRRELKQVRKTRRSDAQCMEKLRTLRLELEAMKAMISIGHKRDIYKREVLANENAIFSVYWRLESFKRQHSIPLSESLPSFRSLNSLLDSKKKRKRHHAGPETLNKIHVPKLVLKSLKYSRPYYHYDMMKHVQKELDHFVANNLSSDIEDRTHLLCYDEIENENEPLKDTSYIPRISRLGRVILDRPNISSAPKAPFLYDHFGYSTYTHSIVSQLGANECQQLNNAVVGSYNHHVLQQTTHISRPNSYYGFAMLCPPVTAEIRRAAFALAKERRASHSSPKKQRHSPTKQKDQVPSIVVTDTEKPTNPQTPAPSPKRLRTSLTDTPHPPAKRTPQITVKVKSKPAISITDSALPSVANTPTDLTLSARTTANRFTVNGLASQRPSPSELVILRGTSGPPSSQ